MSSYITRVSAEERKLRRQSSLWTFVNETGERRGECSINVFCGGEHPAVVLVRLRNADVIILPQPQRSNLFRHAFAIAVQHHH